MSDHGNEDRRYNMIIAGLAVLIVFTLAGLWIVERGRRVRAERELLRRQQTRPDFAGLDELGGILGDGVVKLDHRAMLNRETVEWNGSAREVILLDAPTAEMMGFREGDVIRVCPPAEAVDEEALPPGDALPTTRPAGPR